MEEGASLEGMLAELLAEHELPAPPSPAQSPLPAPPSDICHAEEEAAAEQDHVAVAEHLRAQGRMGRSV